MNEESAHADDYGGPEEAARRAGVEPESLRLWIVLARAYGSVAEHVEKDIIRHGLTVGEFGVLEALLHKGPMLLGDLQRRILVSSGGVTYLVDRLSERGLVERRECPEDRRARFAALTDLGREFIRGIFGDHARVIHRAVGGLTREEKRRAAGLLRKLGLSAAEQWEEGTQPAERGEGRR